MSGEAKPITPEEKRIKTTRCFQERGRGKGIITWLSNSVLQATSLLERLRPFKGVIGGVHERDGVLPRALQYRGQRSRPGGLRVKMACGGIILLGESQLDWCKGKMGEVE